jgi:peroxiredoxin
MNMAAPVARVGDPLPDITLPLLAGGTLALGALRGKRLLLFFWGSW